MLMDPYPYQLTQVDMHQYIPDHLSNLIMNYFNKVTLLVMVLNMIIKAAKRKSRGTKANTKICLPSNRGILTT